jgi:hypothetical protein
MPQQVMAYWVDFDQELPLFVSHYKAMNGAGRGFAGLMAEGKVRFS